MVEDDSRERTRDEAILDGLNDAQLEAVSHGEGPLLIVAGAGTGKTTVLTRRIAHLITSKRARPEEILALTFTEKAAREMAERVDQLVPYGYTESLIATFHAFMPTTMPPNRLMSVMMTAAIASPLTNFAAPSMEP